MKKSKKILLSSLVLSPNLLMAQGALTGKVLYKEDKSAAPYVNVALAGTDRKIMCDEKGQFSLNNVNPGTYELQVTYFDHDTLKETIVIKDKEQLTTELYMRQPKWVQDLKHAQQEQARQDSLEFANRKYKAKRHQPKY
jgi:hypothetical protein